MKHDLKSDLDKIKNRGMALDDDVNLLRDKPIEKIVDYLNSDDPVIRTSAAVNLKPFTDNVCNELLHQLSKMCYYIVSFIFVWDFFNEKSPPFFLTYICNEKLQI